MISLYDYQLDAISRMSNGCILCGGVGSGKSRTALAYYYISQGGSLEKEDRLDNPLKLYIITTARKRDTKEWESEYSLFHFSDVVVDSWNNIAKYSEISQSFFIFDEQRVVGYGAWSKAFIKIAKNNRWILLSATPGDTWLDYIPVFIANGFYKNKTEFIDQHVKYSRYSKYPRVEKYYDQWKLVRLRDRILVNMDYSRPTEQHNIRVTTKFDKSLYRTVNLRWNPYSDTPIANASEFCYLLRRVVNSDQSRIDETVRIAKEKQRVIIFYNFDYELDLLKRADFGKDIKIAEWNGHKHQSIPESGEWVYLVQYTAGAEGWNCIATDTIIFYSQNYSYKVMVQASGRIDRLNSPYKDLYYYHLQSSSSIDLAISRALRQKKKFNESGFAGF